MRYSIHATKQGVFYFLIFFIMEFYMNQVIFKNIGYAFAGNLLSNADLAKQVATASPKFLTLKADDPIKVDIRAGIVQRVAESSAHKIEAFMIYNKDSDSYLSVDDAKFKAHKGEKFHRTVGYIVSTIQNPQEFRTIKEKAKKQAVDDVRTPVKLKANTYYNRLESAVKDILEPKPEGEGKQAEVFQLWSDNYIKDMEKRRKASEARSDIVPPKDWFAKEITTPMQAKLKDWYSKQPK
jgi:hypothetical protein